MAFDMDGVVGMATSFFVALAGLFGVVFLADALLASGIPLVNMVLGVVDISLPTLDLMGFVSMGSDAVANVVTFFGAAAAAGLGGLGVSNIVSRVVGMWS